MNDDDSTDISKIDNLREKIAKEDKRMMYKLWLNNAYRRIITGILILGTIYLGLTFWSELTQDGVITILFFFLMTTALAAGPSFLKQFTTITTDFFGWVGGEL